MTSGKYKKTEEHKRKLGLAKLSDNNPAKRFDVRKKISKALKARFKDKTKHGRYGKTLSEESKNKMSISAKKRCTPEWRKAMSGRMKGKHSKNEWKKGHHCKTEFKSREDNPQWLGGISKLPYAFNFDNELKELIRKRDNYTCQICGRKQEEFKKSLSIHHIDYDKMNSEPKNLISLCRSCHTKTNNDRLYWREFFAKNKR